MNQSGVLDRGGIAGEPACSRPSPDSPVKRETDELHSGSSGERGSNDQRALIPGLGLLGDNTPSQSDYSLFKSPADTRQSVKRHEPLIHSPSGTCMYYHKDILDALQKIVIPHVPTNSAIRSNQFARSSSSSSTTTTTAYSPIPERVDSITPTNIITPTIDYFANPYMYYHDGVFDVPIPVTRSHPASPAPINLDRIVSNPYLFEGEDDDSNVDEDEESGGEENPHDTILPPNLAEREEGVVCTSL